MIDVTNVIKRYGATPVLNGATFRIAEGQLTTILGPSGCGKSTMLRCLNRLERFDEGHIRIGDVEVRGTAAVRLSAAEEDELVHRVRTRVGLVFQNFNLFPHLTALENVIEAPITVKKIPRAQAEEIGRLYLNLVGLSGREPEYPARLSGGQQQRVSIARALAMEPDVVTVRRADLRARSAARPRSRGAAAPARRPQADARRRLARHGLRPGDLRSGHLLRGWSRGRVGNRARGVQQSPPSGNARVHGKLSRRPCPDHVVICTNNAGTS